MHIKNIYTPKPKPISKLDVVVVHGGDNILRAVAAAVGIAKQMIFHKKFDPIDSIADRVIIFSGAQTNGIDQPSEARNMYNIFHNHLEACDRAGEIP